MLPTQISFFNLTIHFYGLIIAFAIVAGYLLAKKRAKIFKTPAGLFEDPILVIPLVLAVIFARLYHVIDFRNYYLNNPMLVFSLNNGGLGIWGALLGIIVGFLLISKMRKINYLNLLDLIAPSLLLGQSIGRIGNYINQEGFGPPTNLPWGVYIAPQNRPENLAAFSRFHPTFFYEAILDFVFFIVLLKLSGKTLRPGRTFALYLILYSLGRAVAEAFRIDTFKVGSFKISYLLCLVALLTGLYFYKKTAASRG